MFGLFADIICIVLEDIATGNFSQLRTDNHPMKPGNLKNAQIVNKVKTQAAQDLFKGGKHIVDEVLRHELPDREPVRGVSNPSNMARQANRPKDPSTLDFTLEEDLCPPNFIREDIWNGVNRRHLLCAIDAHLELLRNAKTWYIEGTFKIIGKPFTQLLTIHAFLNQDGVTKQVPLCYVLISGSKKKDYKKVLKGLLELIPGPRVKRVMVDFEEAFWLAIPAVLGGGGDPGMHFSLDSGSLQACTFHWTQAVFRHAKHLGLQSAYQKDEATRIFIEKILALPYLPAEHIPPMWEKLHRQASEFPASPLKTNLLGLLDYVNNNWINTDRTWKPKNWSAFLQLVRTNNNVRGGTIC